MPKFCVKEHAAFQQFTGSVPHDAAARSEVIWNKGRSISELINCYGARELSGSNIDRTTPRVSLPLAHLYFFDVVPSILASPCAPNPIEAGLYDIVAGPDTERQVFRAATGPKEIQSHSIVEFQALINIYIQLNRLMAREV